MLEWVNPKSTPKRVKPFSVSSNKFYINNNDRTAHFVGHYQLAPLDYTDFYERKDVNENMENEMKEINEKIVEKPYKDDVNFDEAIPMQIRKEITTEAYKDNMDQDIKFVEKNENSKKIFQNKNWRTIYEVIDTYYIQNSNIFPTAFITKCKLYQTNHSSYHKM